MRRLLSAP